MIRSLSVALLFLALGATSVSAQDGPAEPPSVELRQDPSEAPRNLLWIPAVVGLVAGFAFLGGAIDAAREDDFDEQREYARQCLLDDTSSACARLDAVGFAYASARDSESICDPAVASEYGITSQCDELDAATRRYRTYLTLSVIGFAVSVGGFIGYFVRANRSGAAEPHARLRPYFGVDRSGARGGLNLDLTF